MQDEGLWWFAGGDQMSSLTSRFDPGVQNTGPGKDIGSMLNHAAGNWLDECWKLFRLVDHLRSRLDLSGRSYKKVSVSAKHDERGNKWTTYTRFWSAWESSTRYWRVKTRESRRLDLSNSQRLSTAVALPYRWWVKFLRSRTPRLFHQLTGRQSFFKWLQKPYFSRSI